MSFVVPSERVEADDGSVRQSPLQIKSPNSLTNDMSESEVQQKSMPTVKQSRRDSSSGVVYTMNVVMTFSSIA